MIINCKKAAKIIDQEDAAEKVSWWGRRKLKIHLALCKACDGYRKDSEVLVKIISMVSVKHSDKCLSDHEKKEIKQNLGSQTD